MRKRQDGHAKDAHPAVTAAGVLLRLSVSGPQKAGNPIQAGELSVDRCCAPFRQQIKEVPFRCDFSVM
ncbi:hypothetical protein [Paenibacillus chitinolyticus]